MRKYFLPSRQTRVFTQAYLLNSLYTKMVPKAFRLAAVVVLQLLRMILDSQLKSTAVSNRGASALSSLDSCGKSYHYPQLRVNQVRFFSKGFFTSTYIHVGGERSAT